MQRTKRSLSIGALALLGWYGSITNAGTPPATAPTTAPSETTARAGFVIKISAEAVYKEDQTIDLKIIMQNKTDRVYRLSYLGPARDFEITVVGPDQKQQPLTEFGRLNTNAPLISSSMIVLQPQKSSADLLHLNRVFDMTLAGDYTVQVSRVISFDPKTEEKETALSNKLKIHIDDPRE